MAHVAGRASESDRRGVGKAGNCSDLAVLMRPLTSWIDTIPCTPTKMAQEPFGALSVLP